MKDIKTLCLTAKRSGKPTDISSYTEAVKELLESDPNDFITNLEYIITSDIGLTRLDDFAERYGMAVPLCNDIINLLEQAVQKCNTLKKDPSIYESYLEKYKMYRKDHHSHFDMYEYYADDISDSDYVRAFYTFNEKGIQHRKLPAGMINRFGKAAIPDAIITGATLGTKATMAVYEFLNSYCDKYNDSIVKQWIVECSDGISVDDIPGYIHIEEGSLSRLVYQKESEFDDVLRESVITGNDDAEIPYTESDLNNIYDLISLREYQVTCTESTDAAMEIQKEIYSLYESLNNMDGPNGESGLDIIESGSIEKETAKKVADKLNKFGKDMSKDMRHTVKDIHKEIKERLKDGTVSNMRFVRFASLRGAVAVGDSEKPFGLRRNSISSKNQIIKSLMRDDNSGDTLNNLYFHLIIEVDTYQPLNTVQKDAFKELASDAIDRSKISEYMRDGKIDISEPKFVANPDQSKSIINKLTTFEEYVYNIPVVYYTTTVSWTVKISRDFAFQGIDKSLMESICMESFMENIAYMLEEVHEPTVLTEGRFSNTDDKYTGGVPGFLRKNHDLSWGEGDAGKSEDPAETYRRPSADNDEELPKYDDHIDDDGNIKDSDASDEGDRDVPAGVNNYYYYTYTNSNNKNTNSFNQDRSVKDDHSVHKIHDDHSTGKRVGAGYDVEETDVEESAGVLVAAGAVGIISSIISSKIKSERHKKQVDKVLSEIAGKNAKASSYQASAKKLFASFVADNKSKIENCFYKPESYNEQTTDKPEAAFIIVDDDLKEKFGSCVDGKKIVLLSGEVMCGLIKKDKMTELEKKLSEESDLIDVHIHEYIGGLPADDNGHPWEYFIKSGICDGGPEDAPDYEDDEEYEEAFKTYMDEQYKKIKESGYVAAWMCLTADVDKFIKDTTMYTEAVGDADDMKPESDHPIKDMAQDVDRTLAKTQQAAKKKVQGIMNTGKAFMKPVKRTRDWVMKLVHDWKDADETKIKEKIADPHERKGIFNAIAWCIKTGSLAKAGLLLNPLILFLSITKHKSNKDKESRLRHEVIGELKAELAIIKEKIEDARRAGDNKAKYKLMRLRNELNKKLMRVGGSDVRSYRKLL